jgi:hypothetical protein
VIYFADNGAPYAMGKTNFYEPGAGEPLIIRMPGGASGGYPGNPAVPPTVALSTRALWMGI